MPITEKIIRLEAVFQWNRALTLEPEENTIPAIQAKIEDGLPPENDVPATAEDRGRERPASPAADPDERSDHRAGGRAENALVR